jgi:2-oxoglutarate ferredoxin oxidoreductase subunit gamma
MRGGTANCIVIVSDRNISSPIITTFDVVVAMNQPSVDKFESKVKPGGVLIYDSTKIIDPPGRGDVTILPVPASDEAVALGNTRVANMIILGALIGQVEVVRLESILRALRKVLPERYHNLLPLNEQALERGRKFASQGVEAEA